jgi:hypothetical protein
MTADGDIAAVVSESAVESCAAARIQNRAAELS